jgi:hypothetical protein
LGRVKFLKLMRLILIKTVKRDSLLRIGLGRFEQRL